MGPVGKAVYVVFRKSDGYVGAIRAQTPAEGRARLAPYRTRGGEQVSYEILLDADTWPEAQARITAEKAEGETT